MVKTAVIPAAGFGTRFLPASKSIPKEMAPVFDRPAVHYVVEEAVKSGVEKVVFVVSRGKEAIENYFDRQPELEEHLKSKEKEKELNSIVEPALMSNFVFVRQHYPAGLGHAVLCAKPAVCEDFFAVLLPDDLIFSEKPCLMQLFEAMGREKAHGAIALKEVDPSEVSRYGVVSGRREGDVVFIDGMVEKPRPKEAPSNLAIVGRYVLPREVFKAIEETPRGKGGEIQLTDAILSLVGDYRIIGVVFEGERLDVGTPEGFVKANLYIARKKGLF